MELPKILFLQLSVSFTCRLFLSHNDLKEASIKTYSLTTPIKASGVTAVRLSGSQVSFE